MSMPMYASAEQIMRDKTEYARKGIARGRSVAVLSATGGVVLIAENPSSTLHKVGEIYDRIGFAAVGRYNEFENLRQAGIRYADTRGYAYDRRDVTGRGLANAYAQTLGSIFSEQLKPFEVEICVAEVGDAPGQDQLYRLTFDGSVVDEPGFVVMGGQSDAVSAALREKYADGLEPEAAIRVAVEALSSGADGQPRGIPSTNLEIAILERGRPGRAFRRLTAAQVDEILGSTQAGAE
ncbi:proteasome subunit alpha [Cumulibacter manganitolerans]|uniref:proteasome subunit alpha n=1 Tax=Cumulibacter manganitolerans TaxID=1884992 RepID=UPI001294B237|nr:proteasome subunit alpha [Cumulibacter manganitolerans]